MTAVPFTSPKGLSKFASGIVTVRRGALFTRRILPARWSGFHYLTASGLALVALHPTVASVFGPFASKVAALIILLLLLPHLRRINIPVFLSILVTSAYLGIVTGNIYVMVTGIIGYGVFSALRYSSSVFYKTILFILILSAAVAAFQIIIPGSLFNFHATAQSEGDLLNQYRPTSIFPAQAYYNQFLLLIIPITFLLNFRSAWLMAILGIAAAIGGSVSGYILIILSLLLGDRYNVKFVLAGFLSASILIFIFYPEIAMYNYSFLNILDSFEYRILGTGTDEELASNVTDALRMSEALSLSMSYSAILIGIQIVALFGVMLTTMMLSRFVFPLGKVCAFAASALAILAAQMIHPTVGSVYFSLTLGVIAALTFKFLSEFVDRAARPTVLASGE